ncbi:unnamed protein product [Enterobius vermicularis]|uniref:Adenylyl cyclase-associated protein n=1 Tax=Enterobius vermicularis TaxID=51028 RepID=A0A0N4V6P7_ENTVE|nr:unnamed protein product [Enterobius vermicularis]
MRKFIWNASGQVELNPDEMSAKTSQLSQEVEKMNALASSKRTSPFFNHLSALSDGLPAVGWLTVKPTPGPFVAQMRDAAMYYVNRVYKDYKDGDKVHTQWAKSWVELLTVLEKYIRQVHTTGLVWNSSPGALCPNSDAAEKTGSSPQSATVPPPPPVIPPSVFCLSAVFFADSRSALFAEINKGEDITKGLKKVTKDMQTHKNPALRAQVAKETGSFSARREVDKPPKLALENGKQWNVEYYKDEQNIVVEITDMKQTVYIYKCENCVIQVKGKVNSITMDGCKKTSVVFESLLSQVEIINCQSAQVQTLGAMPTISIQKTDGCQVYLSKDSLNAEFITSKSSTMNILVPSADGDFQEYPIPEQFKTIFDGKKLQTTVSDIV